ncbi:unnamed protein product [Adineta steineri]|uniref:Uncharacterized protein n=1 Tax=Adineta steineri TaxID=433720 RepID=A0A813QLS3_9BILA|nr:unnamed protein product [Adineta steineri]CAF4036885.1 unnamed protein product [Adineta steineri]
MNTVQVIASLFCCMLLFGALSKAQSDKNSDAQMSENKSKAGTVRARRCEEGNVQDGVNCRGHCMDVGYDTGHCREIAGEWRCKCYNQ